MHRNGHFLLVAIVILVNLFPASTALKAQGAVGYKFLEVVDFAGKPVEDAKVQTKGCFDDQIWKTNQNGQLEDGLPVCYGDYQTNNFTVSKPGYYTFEDLGLLYLPFRGYYRGNYVDKYRVELLKIPQNAVERKILGREELKRELFLAIKYGKTEEVNRLLKAGLDPNLSTNNLRGVPGPKEVPAIVYAAAQVDIETIKVLLAAGADLRGKNSNARDILLYYLGASLEPLGNPFLNYYKKQTEERRADPIRFFEKGFDILLKAGADREVANADSRLTPLKSAARKGYIGLIKKLLGAGVSAQAKGDALLDLIESKDERDLLSMELADLLIKAGADLNFAFVGGENADDEYCVTPLMAAGNAGKFGFVKLLLANKADINFACKSGKTALISALRERHPETAKLLLEAGASAGGKRFGSLSQTALIVAAEKDYAAIVEMLIARGALVNARDKVEESALERALWGNAGGATINLLLKAGANPNGQIEPYCAMPLMLGASRGNTDALRLLIAYKADVNLVCGSNDAPVVYAARNNQLEAVKILLDAGALVTGEQGKTALKYARKNLQNDFVKNKAEEIIKLLENAGAQ